MDRMDGLDSAAAKTLYGDIDSIGVSLENQRIQQDLSELRRKHDAVSSELADVKAQLIKAINEKDTIERNLIQLYNTATKEISRKDKEIMKLATELDALKTRMR